MNNTLYTFQYLLKDNSDNAGGMLSTIWVMPYGALEYNGNESAYTEFYPESNLVVTDDNFSDADSWLKFGAIPDTCDFESGSVIIDGVDMIATSFKAQLPKVTLKGIQVMRSLVLSRCLAIVQDRNGNRRVLGRKDEATAVRFKEVTGKALTDLNNIELELNLTSSLPPAFLP